MFTLIQAESFHINDSLLEATFKLRKKVFADQLNWDVPVKAFISLAAIVIQTR